MGKVREPDLERQLRAYRRTTDGPKAAALRLESCHALAELFPWLSLRGVFELHDYLAERIDE